MAVWKANMRKLVCAPESLNPNQQAVDIAKSHCVRLCEAIVRQPFVNDSAMLHSRPFFALIDNVAMNKDDPNSKRSNEVVFRKGTIRSINSGTTPGLAAGWRNKRQLLRRLQRLPLRSRRDRRCRRGSKRNKCSPIFVTDRL